MAKKPLIKDPLPRPVKCDSCGSLDIQLADNKQLYGKSFGKWPIIWLCWTCEASVGCHAETDIPLGFMADRETRQLRLKAHNAFDPLWKKSGKFKRITAYTWLASMLQIPLKECHISQFSKKQCELTVIYSKRKLRELRQCK